MKRSLFSRLFLLLSIGLIVSGCATLDKNECLVANWESIGYEDGTRGRQAAWIGKHRTACAKYGVAPDLALYTQGREQGLTLYCRANVGYREGIKGKTYQNVCPVESERDFLTGYRFGQRIHKIHSRIHRLKRQIKKEEKLLDELAVTVSDTEAELIRSGVSRKRRALLLHELKILSERKHDSEDVIADWVDRLDKAQHRMRRLQARNPYVR